MPRTFSTASGHTLRITPALLTSRSTRPTLSSVPGHSAGGRCSRCAIALEGARDGVTTGRAKLAARVPMGHIGDPADIAEAAAYLCSEAAGYVTGVVLDVDGGISIGSALR
ncbi:SDR family oxidoreductase [Amycolatopsis deserti]|uniref:SDR family oxidoreductase n=1 Tax=Amycolatopsis deserti TaxID=185696 RepID=UPI001E331553|nr:SDR family oxidoreductase [Amycolatopsis deserti]